MGEDQQTKKAAWYFNTSVVVVALLSAGPLALPLVWWHPRYRRAVKIVVTVVTLVLTYALWGAMKSSLKTLKEYYQMLES